MTNSPALTATIWGGAGMLAGAVTALLVALPFYPHDTTGWEGLGWVIATAAAAAVLGLLVGAVALHRGLRRVHADHPGWTVVAFVPLAVLLMGVSGGVGALLAPAAAVALVRLVARRAPRRTTAPGWGAPAA